MQAARIQNNDAGLNETSAHFLPLHHFIMFTSICCFPFVFTLVHFLCFLNSLLHFIHVQLVSCSDHLHVGPELTDDPVCINKNRNGFKNYLVQFCNIQLRRKYQDCLLRKRISTGSESDGSETKALCSSRETPEASLPVRGNLSRVGTKLESTAPASTGAKTSFWKFGKQSGVTAFPASI